MKDIFLATTALEDFWDTSKPIVFLGEWCKRYGRRSVWQKLSSQTIVDPWKNGYKIEEESCLIKALYEKVLLSLTHSLNRLHGINASNRYWRIVLGPWLCDYLIAVHDRIVFLQAAKSQFPNFSTILLAEESFITPRNSREFNWLSSEDTYNLQLYTKILSFWGEHFPRKPKEIQVESPSVNIPSVFKRINIRRLARELLKKIGWILNNEPSVILASSYFSRPTMIQLFLRSHGKVWPLFQESMEAPYFPLDVEKRNRLSKDFQASSELERLLADILPLDIPQSFVEAFQYLRKIAKEKYPHKPNVIFSANAWYYSDDFKQWAASQSEMGTLLIGTQHGGNYGSLLFHPSEEHEVAISDRFYTWGWKNGSHKVQPFFSTKLVAYNKVRNYPQEKSILFGATCIPRYFHSYTECHPVHFIHYLSWQSRFFNLLPPHLRQQLHLRPHCTDYGWDIAERWRETIPEATIENWGSTFSNSLMQSKIYVCDNLSTTFIEALTAGKPTILFWNFGIFRLRFEAKPFYDALCSVNILHSSPESAANHLINVYEDVESWWNEPQCCKIRQEFCHEFGRTSKKAVSEWVKEFKRMKKDFNEKTTQY